METNVQHNLVVDYDTVVKLRGFDPSVGFRYFELKNGDEFLDGMVDRSVLLKDIVMVWLCRSGNVSVLVDGVGHIVTAGQMLVVFANTYCHFSSPSHDFVADSIMGRITYENSVESIVGTFPRVRQMPVVSLLKQENTTLSALMNYIECTSKNNFNPSRADIDSNVLSLLRSELVDIFLRRNLAVRESTPDEQLVKRFNVLLAVHSFEHRDVDHYAAEFNLTPKVFAMKVKKVAGTTPSDLIASAVIRNAKKLLSSTELNSAEIAEKLNFANPSFFCRYFKRYTGLTPQEWRSRSNLL